MSAIDGACGVVRSAGSLVAAAGAVGFAVMAAELSAVRVLAPHFGDSAYVWTNVIGVILAAMASGATLGGRLATRRDAERWPPRLLLAGALLLAVSPHLVGWLGTRLLPSDLPLEAAMPALIRGSLLATTLTFAPPLFLLAAVSPLLVVMMTRHGATVGRAAGDVAAAGTLGSLCGTFAATHWLVPELGCRWAFGIAGAVSLVAALLLGRCRPRTGGIVGVVFAATLPWGAGPLRPVAASVELLAERETAYQYLQVQRSTESGGAARTTLVINEGLDSYHSVAIEGSVFTGGAYFDWHALAPLCLEPPVPSSRLKVLSIGDAAGSLRRVYWGVHPGAQVDAVDIDAETMALGDEFFAGPKAAGRRYALDGRLFVGRASERWHVVHVDAYAHQVYVPAHLASREFFVAARRCLEPGGVLALNVGALRLDDAVLEAIAATVREVFGNAIAMHVPQTRNALLIARNLQQAGRLRLHGGGGERLSAADRERWSGVLEQARRPGVWLDVGHGGPVLHDDRPQLDELLFRSYVDVEDRGAAITCSGSLPVIAAEAEANQAVEAGDWDRVLERARASREPSPLLRRLAGDARWMRRELRSAVAEYEAGLTLSPDAALATSLRQRVEGANAQLAPVLAAEQAGRRNGWLALFAGLLVGLLGWVAVRAAARRG